MSSSAPPDPEQLLRRAREGDREVLGRLLELYRRYLMMLAQLHVDRRLQGKVDASDVVQDVFLQAYRGFGKFRGSTERELLQWLRTIVASKIANLVRHFCGTQSRDVRVERRLSDELDRSSQIAEALVRSQSGPSQRAARREEAVLLADALGQLPPHYHEVIMLHHLEELTFPEVAQHMGRSVASVKQLWVRALATLRRSLGGQDDASH